MGGSLGDVCGIPLKCGLFLCCQGIMRSRLLDRSGQKRTRKDSETRKMATVATAAPMQDVMFYSRHRCVRRLTAVMIDDRYDHHRQDKEPKTKGSYCIV